jgi:hypothetical protein
MYKGDISKFFAAAVFLKQLFLKFFAAAVF